MENTELPLGRYQHYKGGVYEVIGVASHSETLEKLVVYRHCHSSILQKAEMINSDQEKGEDENELGDLWVRPLSMFTEMVEVEGKKVPRFKHIQN